MFNKTILPLLLITFLCAGAPPERDLSNPLPNWVDPAREAPVSSDKIFVNRLRTPTPSGFRIPAEYEPVGAVVLGWAGYTDMLASVARAAAGAGANILAVWGPQSISGVPASNYTPVNLSIDTVWVRDYGPFGLTGPGRLGIVDSIYRHYNYRPDDDALPVNLGRMMSIDVFGVPVILDGGNIMFDSYGNLFMTKRTYLWNSNMSQERVDAALKEYFKVKNVYAFDYAGYPGQPRDGTGHIDMFMKLLNDHTVLIALADTEPHKTNSEKALAWFQGRRAPDGQPYKIITVKGWETYGTWYTYTNSLIVNNTVIMPSYRGASTEEARAIAAYKEGMPGVNVVPVNSDSSIRSGGSIHCVTQTIPVLQGKKDAKDYAGEVKESAAPVSPAMDQLIEMSSK